MRSITWDNPDWPEVPPGRMIALARGVLTGLWTGAGFLVFGLVRLAELAAVRGARRWSPWVAVATYRGGLRLVGLGYVQEGSPMPGPGLIVANHVGWLDIFALGAAAPVTFVAKSEVRRWPGIGLLARGIGTLFLNRERRAEAGAQVAEIARRMRAGERLLVFPEGTSTDNDRVLPFKPTLFAAITAPGLPEPRAVQPVTLVYEDERGDPRRYGWWGEMSFGRHLAATLSGRQGRIRVIYHAPIPVTEATDRKALARQAEDAVRAGLSRSRRPAP